MCSTPTNSQPTLTYFDFGGRAELARLLFTYGGVTFIDNRVTGPEFREIKSTLPLGQLPTLEIDGVMYAQSMAIARYAAKLAGLYPQDAKAALHVDMVSETLIDVFNTLIDIKYRTTDEAVKAEKTAKFLSEGLPKVLGALERMVRGSFFAGDSATLADIHLFDTVLNFVKTSFPDTSLAAFPKLEMIIEAVKMNANVAAYLAKHQK